MYRTALYYLFLFLVAGLAACTNQDGRSTPMPSLTETYNKVDKKPFGNYIAYQQLQAMYSSNVLRDKTKTFTDTWADISYIDTSSLYVCMAADLYLNDDEVSAMLDYVAAGNDLFIAANNIDEKLLKKIESKETFTSNYFYDNYESMVNTSVSIPPTQPPRYSYYYFPLVNYFPEYDKSNTKVLGYNEAGQPDYIVHFHGKGKLFLQCDVKAFSNYFLLNNNNYEYMQHAFAYTRRYPSHLYWDNYYNKLHARRENSGSNFSSFDELAKHPALLNAFWLALILLILYILFNSKRKQRIIKVIKPNENSTVNFTETIGLLYLQKKDNKNVADKMVTYFNEYIRNNYFLNTGNINEDFITTLSRKSGVQRDKVDALYRSIQHTQQSATFDDYQVLSLNELIQNFYKTKN